MEPERVDWPVLVQKLNTSDFEAVTLGWSSVPESDPYQVFHSNNIKDQGDNRTAYSNPELDKVIDKGRTTMDKEARMKYWHQVHQILHDDQPYTFMFNRKALRLFNERVHNVKESKLGLNYEHLNGGVLPWYIPTTMHKYEAP
jgi:peptide/nickel transport system substrate-binding protein